MGAYRCKQVSLFAMALAIAMLAGTLAEARRGGSFGSRGSRTYYAPRATPTAPRQAPPVQRSMTSRSPEGAQAARPSYAQAPIQRPGFGRFGGFGGGLLGGLLAGGLIGGLMGHGFGGGWGGGGGGFMTILLQIAIAAAAVWFIMKLFRRPAPAGSAWSGPQTYSDVPAPFAQRPLSSVQLSPASDSGLDIEITQQDRDTFERLLKEVQDAFGREDYGALRERTTPEIMSYLAEELSQNATQGRRNEVIGTRLLQADVGEVWQERDMQYATSAMRYESIDLMRDRQTGSVLQGDPAHPTETTEIWTFVRRQGETWKLSAIQES
jgi:predicted lipid-binding transport protein (Tim44 family)